MSAETRVAAYQLSLLGDPPKAGRAWERTFRQWTLGGLRLPLRPDELRQLRLLHADTWTPELQAKYEREMAEWNAHVTPPSRGTP